MRSMSFSKGNVRGSSKLAVQNCPKLSEGKSLRFSRKKVRIYMEPLRSMTHESLAHKNSEIPVAFHVCISYEIAAQEPAMEQLKFTAHTARIDCYKDPAFHFLAVNIQCS